MMFSLCVSLKFSCVFQTIGNGAVAQAVLSRDRLQQLPDNTTMTNTPLGTEMSINLGYGVGVMVGAYIAIGVSGGHMNPAVTLAMALTGKICWFKVSKVSIC